jgi:hypothetical protein
MDLMSAGCKDLVVWGKPPPAPIKACIPSDTSHLHSEVLTCTSDATSGFEPLRHGKHTLPWTGLTFLLGTRHMDMGFALTKLPRPSQDGKIVRVTSHYLH